MIISQLVITETRRNLVAHAPQKTAYLDQVFESLPFEIVNPTKEEVSTAARFAVLKDAPILAAARKAKVDFLVTLDKQHLLEKPELGVYIEAEIVTPKQAVERILES